MEEEKIETPVQEPKVETTETVQPEVIADEVVPVTVCANCNNSGKECLVCSDKTVKESVV